MQLFQHECEGFKTCKHCGQSKPVDEFHFHKNRGVISICKQCCEYRRKHVLKPRDNQRDAARQRIRYKSEKDHDKRLRKLYGITLEQHTEMYIKQGGVCAICNKKDKLHVDHCHETGVVRGLLCGHCNKAMGLFEDDVWTIERALEYLKKHVENTKHIPKEKRFDRFYNYRHGIPEVTA